MSLKKPALFCGESGTAKTVTCNACFKGLELEKHMFLNINMSSRTTSLDF
jgi:transcriptional regulator of aromatic amino acid metabolism